MELMSQRAIEHFNEKLNVLIAHIQTSVENGKLDSQAGALQTKLDALAAQYQNDESLGTARYKLYEAQALLHYFMHQDAQARQFIQEAIKVRGGSYDTAAKLLADLDGRSPAQPVGTGKKPLSGIGGWLLLFVIGLILGALFNAHTIFEDYKLLQDGELLALLPSIKGVLWFEIISCLFIVAGAGGIIYLLANRKKVARNVVIAFLVAVAIIPIIDYEWARSVFAAYPDALTAIEGTSKTIGRNIVYAFIWIPYFMTSKRVQNTLTEE